MAGGGRSRRDARSWVASCLWTQCKFKSNEGLAKTFDEDGNSCARGCRERCARSGRRCACCGVN